MDGTGRECDFPTLECPPSPLLCHHPRGVNASSAVGRPAIGTLEILKWFFIPASNRDSHSGTGRLRWERHSDERSFQSLKSLCTMIHSPLPVAYLEGGVALRKLLCRRLILAASSLNSTGVSSRYRAWRVFSQRQVLVEVKGDISQADSKNYCGQAGTDYFKMNRGAFLCFVKVLRGYGTTTHSKGTLQFVLEGHRAS
ncbi:uncharacterized protein LOC111270992 [Varroa jacobsoni]|uniref:uncharacterized protein LOC111270992 n=1 Tax=Varroa jacobsoni TaxID=62625 RepID=UPI000BF97919|nr:uncharacterized protein LOC111270992 [Varroa jacobsoni]